MGNWDNYKYEERHRVEPGEYRVAIVSAEEKISKSKKPMLKVGIRPAETKMTIYEYFVDGEYFNQNISRFFDAFPEIESGNFNLISWIGCIGAAKLKQDGDFLRVHYFMTPEQAQDLPEWKGEKPERQEVSELTEDADGLPF